MPAVLQRLSRRLPQTLHWRSQQRFLQPKQLRSFETPEQVLQDRDAVAFRPQREAAYVARRGFRLAIKIA